MKFLLLILLTLGLAVTPTVIIEALKERATRPKDRIVVVRSRLARDVDVSLLVGVRLIIGACAGLFQSPGQIDRTVKGQWSAARWR